MPDRGGRAEPSLRVTVPVVALVVAGNAFTAVAFGLASAIGTDTGTDATGRSLAEWAPIPAAGVAIAGGVLAHVRRQWLPLKIGTAVAIIVALAPWVVFGDPAGNFGGLATRPACLASA